MFQRNSNTGADSAGHGPFAGPGGSRDRQLFIGLKPICVQILTHCRPGQTGSPRLASDLSELRSALAKAIPAPVLPGPLSPCSIKVNTKDPPVGASLLRYVFFPISQLFQAAPKGPAELPDSTRREAFACLHLLAEQWWRQWTDIGTASSQQQESIQVWRQLLILAAIALTPSAPKESPPVRRTDSPETSLAILRLLHSLLVPRVQSPAPPLRRSTPEKQWEWDGESELPSLDELDADFAGVNVDETNSKRSAVLPTIYPTSQHQALCNDKQYLSPLVHALTACLDLATESESHSSLLELKSTALEVTRIIVTYWIAPSGLNAADRAKKMATVLPGIVGKVVTLLTTSGGKADATHLQSIGKIPGPLVARAVSLLTDVCQVVLSDEATAAMRQYKGDAASVQSMKSLQEVVAEANRGDDGEAAPPASADDNSPSSPNTRTSIDSLQVTLKNLTLAVQTLASDAKNTEGLGAHTHPLAQQAVVALSKSLLQNCALTMTWFEETSGEVTLDEQPSLAHFTTILLRWLLDLADDSSTAVPKSTSDAARDALRDILRHDSQQGSHQLCLRIGKETASCLEQVSNDIASQRGPQAARLARRVCAAVECLAELLSTASPRTVELVAQLMTHSRTERWGTKLINSMQVSSALSSAQQHNIEASADDLSRVFPALGVDHLDASEARSLSAMLREYGVLCGGLTLAQLRLASSAGEKQKRAEKADAVGIVDYFLESCRRSRRLFKAQTTSLNLLQQSTGALYISRELVVGIARVLQDTRLALEPGKVGRRARKVAHRFAERLVADVLEAWEEEAALVSTASNHEMAMDAATTKRESQLASQADHDTSGATSYSKGLPSLNTPQEMTARPQRFGPALNLSFVDSAVIAGDVGGPSSGTLSRHTMASMMADNSATQRSLQLSLLALSSLLLGPSFRSHLLPTLYPTISALATPSPDPAQTASDALTVIAHSSGYADLLTCVRENVDYILGEASWRLVSGLGRELEWRVAQGGDQSTVPAALLSAVSPPMVLTQVMRLLGPESLHLIEDSIDEVLDALDRFHGYADICESLLVVLDRLLEVMRQGQREGANVDDAQTAGVPSRPCDNEQLDDFDVWLVNRTRRASGTDDVESAFDKVESAAQEVPNEEGEEDSTSTPAATRSQRLISTIVSKSIPFLSHSNPVIRSRVLRILGAGTELLCPVSASAGRRREDDLLPLINRCWPLVVARLGWDMNRSIGSKATPTSEDIGYVHIAAIDLCRIFAVHIPDFMGRRIAQDAWPRIKALIALRVREAENSKRGDRGTQTRRLRGGGAIDERTVSTNEAERNGATTTTTTTTTTALLYDPHSPLSQILHATTQALTPLVAQQGPSFPSTTLWEILSHPVLSRKVDVDLLQASERCDGLGTVWSLCALSGRSTWSGLQMRELDPAVGKVIFG